MSVSKNKNQAVAVQLAVALMPNRLRGWVFKKLLHR